MVDHGIVDRGEFDDALVGSFLLRDEGCVFIGLLRARVVAPKVSIEADLEEEEGALFLDDRGRVCGGGLCYLPHID